MRAERESRNNLIHLVGSSSQISSVCKDSNVERIIVAVDEGRGKLPVDELLSCRFKGIRVDDGIAFTEALSGKVFVDDLRPSFLIFSDGFHKSFVTRKLKRCIDIIASVIGLLVFAPFYPLLAMIIKLDSSGPVVYRQERMGQDGKMFSLLKFRSMRVDGESNGPVWAAVNDKRVTRVGSIIRKLRLDEIPQMVNVLRGEMSFVGPRPERPFFIRQLEKDIPFYSIRHMVKPGITGWAQIEYPYGASREDALEKLKYDLYYIKHMSIFFDLLIMVRTVKTVVFARGAR